MIRGLRQLRGPLRVNTVLLFPGQGAQISGMLHTLGNHPAVEETLNEISEALKCDVRTFDSPEALRMTVPVQLALLAAGVATARTLRRSGLELSAVAGLSVGAFSAAVAADAISLAAAVTLVHSRAEQMAAEGRKGRRHHRRRLGAGGSGRRRDRGLEAHRTSFGLGASGPGRKH